MKRTDIWQSVLYRDHVFVSW